MVSGGMKQIKKYIKPGDVFVRLTVVARLGVINGCVCWLVRCVCGRYDTAITADLNRGHKKSCGCLQRDTIGSIGKEQIVHGNSRRTGITPEIRCWNLIKRRCYNKNSREYQYYGTKGKTVCERWLDKEHGSNNFLADMGAKPEPKSKYSIDRIDNDGNYEPGNCRWATMVEQRAN